MIKKILALPIALIFLSFASFNAIAKSPDELQQEINELTQKVAIAQSQEKSLSSQLAIINGQISITKLNIESTEQKLGRLTDDIASVSGKITRLEQSLQDVSNILANRIVKTYTAGRTDPLIYLIGAGNLQDFLGRLDYLRIAQKHDKNLMYEMASSRKNYNDQKVLLEGRKIEVEQLSTELKNYQANLDKQNREKQALLDITRSDEARYQNLLDQARREIAAIQTSQYTGKKDVKKGDVIGLMGNTGFSSGPHLHFGVYELSESQSENFNYNSNSLNPFSFLSSRSLPVAGDACYEYSGGTQQLGSGSWMWGLANPRISQCFGKTPYSTVYANGRHEGVDMYDNIDVTVRAVDDGVAFFYRGSSSFGNNVRIFHSNGKMSLYLHLQ